VVRAAKSFAALVHIYAELRLPFDAALDAAEADLLREQNEGPEKRPHGRCQFPTLPSPTLLVGVPYPPSPASLYRSSPMSNS